MIGTLHLLKPILMMKNPNIERRCFLKKIAIGSLATLTIPEIVSAAMPEKRSRLKINTNDVILFQGDSITDAGRSKTELKPNIASALGSGYALLAAADILFAHPEKNLKIYNKGISGNKVYQLAERWENDTLSLQPNILSILIGVNDFWHMMNGNYNGNLDTYRNDYIKLIKQTKEKLPNVQLIIGEPYALNGPSVKPNWFPLFNDYRKAAKDIAAEFNATFIPYQAIFEKAYSSAPSAYWSADGVHPSIAGARLIATALTEVLLK